MKFPERLKKLRTEKKMTQEELGDKINVTKVSVSGYESGNRKPDVETLEKLADVLNVSVDFLLGRSDNPFPTDENEDLLQVDNIKSILNKNYIDYKLFTDFKKLSPEEQEEFKKNWYEQVKIVLKIKEKQQNK